MKYPKAYIDYMERIAELVKNKAMLLEYDMMLKPAGDLKDKRYPKGYAAEMDIDTRYLEIQITLGGRVYKMWKEKNYRGLTALMAHEVTHALTDPYYEFFYDCVPKTKRKQLEHLNEMQTERLSKIIMLNIKPKEYLP